MLIFQVNPEHFVFSTFGVLHFVPKEPNESMELREWQREAVLWTAVSTIPFLIKLLIFQVNPEHFVFSTFGVLHVVPKEPNESMELGEWQREAVLWTAVSTIPFLMKLLIFQVNPEHFVFSTFGVLHVVPKEPNESMELGEWQREAVLWTAVSTIPFLMKLLIFQVNPEHFVFSTFGVLHVVPKEPNESMELGEWQREAVLWTAVSTIPFLMKLLIFQVNPEHFVFSTFGALHVVPKEPNESMELGEWQREAVLWTAVSTIPFLIKLLIFQVNPEHFVFSTFGVLHVVPKEPNESMELGEWQREAVLWTAVSTISFLMKLLIFQVNPEHFVFSTFGVLHVVPKEPNESMELGEWQREAVLWSAVSTIPFFKNYLVMKMFDRWAILLLVYALFYLHLLLELFISIFRVITKTCWMSEIEPPYEKTGILHMRKQRRRSVSR